MSVGLDLSEDLHPLLAASASAYSSLLQCARVDFPTFCSLVLRDEEKGEPITLMPFHFEWSDVLEKNRNVVLWTHPDAGKTSLMAIARPLWVLGRDPRQRIAVLSATQNAAKKVIRTIQGYIVNSKTLRDVFPNLRRGLFWTDSAIEVRRPSGIKDPSVQAYSPEGGNMQGARLDGLIVDDVLNENNTRTRYQREKIEEWIRSSAFTRLSEDAWIAFLTNAWHPDDMAHVLERQGWWAKRYPVIDDAGRSTWPERWPLSRIEHVRTKTLGPVEFSRQMLCQPRDESTARFKREWIETCLARGEGHPLVQDLNDLAARYPMLAEAFQINDSILAMGGLPDNVMVVSGVDVSTGREKSDLSVIFTLLTWPDGSRQILEIQSGRWQGPEIIDRLASVHDRFRSVMVVENNAAQEFILQWTREKYPGLRVRSFTTGRNKLSPEYGVESLAGELAAGRWIIPCQQGNRIVDPQVGKWISDLVGYDPGRHTGDLLMACIAPGYLVVTKRGLVPIEQVVRGDFVLTHKSRWQEVTGTTCTWYRGDAVRLRACGFVEILMTAEHPVWSALPWVNPEHETRAVPHAWDFRSAVSLRAGEGPQSDFVFAPGVPDGMQEDGAGDVVRIEYARHVMYEGLVCNLHVKHDESFVVEGIAVHNSWFAREASRMYETHRRKRKERQSAQSNVRILGK